MEDERAQFDREELERAGGRARTRLNQIEALVAAQSRQRLSAGFPEVRDALLDAGGPGEQLTRDLLAHGDIAPGRRASVVGDDTCLWELLAMLEVMLQRLRRELTDTELAALGIRPRGTASDQFDDP
jgi:hypothetical protein